MALDKRSEGKGRDVVVATNFVGKTSAVNRSVQLIIRRSVSETDARCWAQANKLSDFLKAGEPVNRRRGDKRVGYRQALPCVQL